ncbi:MAG: hypothetical protein HC888_01410 [Candidatus Competibacteraceae bacterium]|nr:hypothetical protein [Candidatus Competibacteraceae bacterium]
MARFPTLLDMTMALEPDGGIAAVAELLHQTNEVMADWTFMEGNLTIGHQTTVRTGLPTVTWRKLYGGVQPDKSRRARITDSCGMMEAYNEVDKALADLNSNANEFRASEARAQIEAMSQDLAETLFYGNITVNPERFEGLASRYSTFSADNGDNLVEGGGTGSDNASIWLVAWDPNAIFGIVPKGSTAGIQMNDKGQVTVEDADGAGGRMEAYRTHFRVDAGLVLKDWRYVVRICNIDRSLLSPTLATGADLNDLMSEAVERLPMVTANTAFYMDRNTRQMWRKQTAHKLKDSTLTREDIGGVKSPIFDDIPIRRVDRLAVDEARVV